MADLETRQLRYFVAVAEELHFGRAAERLGMAQPPLSRAIRVLERELGVQLLVRSTRHVSLAPAGEVLLAQSVKVLQAVAAATALTRQAGRCEPVLRVALKADYDAGLLPTILRAFDQDADGVQVELVLGGRGEQVPALLEGRADVALIPTPFLRSGLDTEALLTERRVVAVAADDPLAARRSLTLADLVGRCLPDGTPAEHGLSPEDRTSYESIGLPVPAEGPAPESGLGRLDLAQIFSLIELGRIVLFVPESVARRYPRPDVSYRIVDDLEPVTLCAAWPQKSRSPAVASFVQIASRAATAQPISTAEVLAVT